MRKVVLAYSGGLDTSIIIPWLIENYQCQVVAFAADVGQGKVETKSLKERALAAGACDFVIKDLRQEFVEEYIWPTLKAGAKYEGTYLLGTSMARPVIAKHQMMVAKEYNADTVAHGATGKGNDQVRFELAYMAIDPNIKIIAPWKDSKWNINSREMAIDYANQKKIPLTVSKEKIYSEDGNLWHLSHEGGILEFVDKEHKYDMLTMGVTPQDAPDKFTYVQIDFEQGCPIAIDGKKIPAVELIEKLNKIAGANGCGLLDIVENRLVGMKSRGVYETPGGSLLYAAHELLEQLVLDRDTLQYKQQLSIRYAQLVYDGLWFTPLREALDAFVKSTQKTVTGSVTLKLYKGNITLAKMKSPYSLYDEDLGGFSDVEMYSQQDANGFIRCLGLPLKVRSLKLKK